MKTIGYCETCHRFRPVRVTATSMALYALRRGVLTGECDDCDDKRRRR